MSTQSTTAIVYSAFSTAKGDTLEAQVADCEAMAEREGWEVVGRYSDVGKSAFKGDRGQGLADAMAHAEREAPCVLLARDPERFARGDSKGEQGARSFMELAVWASRSNVTLRTVRDDGMVATPMLAGIVSELVNAESRRKAQRATSGADSRRAKGLHTGGHIFGYRSVNGGLVPDPVEAPVVRRIFDALASGVSQAELARILNQEREATGQPTPRSGGDWNQGSISALVRRRTYLGEVAADSPSERSDPRVPVRWVKGHEAIIPLDVWEAAHARIADRARKPGRSGGRRPKAGHLLPGKLLRHDCGRAMTPRSHEPSRRDGSITGRYVCSGARGGVCDGLTVDRATVDDAVLAFVASVAIDADESVKRARAAADAEAAKHAEAVRHNEREVKEAKSALKRAQGDYLSGKLDAEDYNAFKATLTARRESAEARLREHQGTEPPTAEEVVSATVDALGVVRRAIDAGETQRVVEAIARIFDYFIISTDEPYELPAVEAAEAAKARAHFDAIISRAEAQAGRTVAQGSAMALASEPSGRVDPPDENERSLTAAESADDEALRAGGLIILPVPRDDALATAMVDSQGKQVFQRVPLTTHGVGLHT